jgi:ribosomal protein L37AE/L43A
MIYESKNVKKIKEGNCPYCERKLKPSARGSSKGVISVLECRYCKITVKISDIRNNTIPKQFNEEVEKERQEKLKSCKHTPVPKECPYCESVSIREYPDNYTWECLECEDMFEWRYYEVRFSGEVTLAAESRQEAESKAYNYTDDLDCDAWEVDR